jgi:hypothetical protein
MKLLDKLLLLSKRELLTVSIILRVNINKQLTKNNILNILMKGRGAGDNTNNLQNFIKNYIRENNCDCNIEKWKIIDVRDFFNNDGIFIELRNTVDIISRSNLNGKELLNLDINNLESINSMHRDLLSNVIKILNDITINNNRQNFYVGKFLYLYEDIVNIKEWKTSEISMFFDYLMSNNYEIESDIQIIFDRLGNAKSNGEELLNLDINNLELENNTQRYFIYNIIQILNKTNDEYNVCTFQQDYMRDSIEEIINDFIINSAIYDKIQSWTPDILKNLVAYFDTNYISYDRREYFLEKFNRLNLTGNQIIDDDYNIEELKVINEKSYRTLLCVFNILIKMNHAGLDTLYQDIKKTIRNMRISNNIAGWGNDVFLNFLDELRNIKNSALNIISDKEYEDIVSRFIMIFNYDKEILNIYPRELELEYYINNKTIFNIIWVLNEINDIYLSCDVTLEESISNECEREWMCSYGLKDRYASIESDIVKKQFLKKAKKYCKSEEDAEEEEEDEDDEEEPLANIDEVRRECNRERNTLGLEWTQKEFNNRVILELINPDDTSKKYCFTREFVLKQMIFPKFCIWELRNDNSGHGGKCNKSYELYLFSGEFYIFILKQTGYKLIRKIMNTPNDQIVEFVIYRTHDKFPIGNNNNRIDVSGLHGNLEDHIYTINELWRRVDASIVVSDFKNDIHPFGSFMNAVVNKDLYKIKLLLQLGANPNLSIVPGDSSDFPIESSAMCYLNHNWDKEIYDLIMEYGKILIQPMTRNNNEKNRTDITRLYNMILTNPDKLSVIQQYYTKLLYDIYVLNPNRYTENIDRKKILDELWVQIHNNNLRREFLESIPEEMLLSVLNDYKNNGETPLTYAVNEIVTEDTFDMVDLLIEFGVNINNINNDGENSLEISENLGGDLTELLESKGAYAYNQSEHDQWLDEVDDIMGDMV